MRQGSHREGRFLLGFAGFLSGVLCCAQMARVSEIQGSLLPRWKREARDHGKGIFGGGVHAGRGAIRVDPATSQQHPVMTLMRPVEHGRTQ